MNYNCKYCDYVDKCSRRCEYGSLLCVLNRSFPKVVERPYKEVLYENSDLKLKLERKNKVIEEAINYLDGAYEMSCYTKMVILEKENIEDLRDILNKGVDEK